MSYILDALKKSEEERHQGQLPNLGSNSALIHNAKKRTSLWPWVIALLLMLNVSFIGFWVLNSSSVSETASEHNNTMHDSREPNQAQIPVEISDVTRQDSYTEAVMQDIPQAALKLSSSNQAKVAKIPANQTKTVTVGTNVEPKQASVNLPTIQQPPTTSTVSTRIPQPTSDIVGRSGKTVDTSQPELIVPGGGYKADSLPNETTIVDEAPLLITPKGKSRPYTGPAYTAEVAPQDASPIRREQGQAVESDGQVIQVGRSSSAVIPRLLDKPHEFQVKIPDMAFNSHIYTDAPSSRRVMINNIYLREGQTFSGMRVEQITEEGIVLSLDNESFKIGVLRDWYSPR